MSCHGRQVLCSLQGAIAQLGERLPRTQEVVGSTPSSSTNRSFYWKIPTVGRSLSSRVFSMCHIWVAGVFVAKLAVLIIVPWVYYFYTCFFKIADISCNKRHAVD